MKIPFPYWLAAEFYLFQPPAKKLTVIHLLIPIAGMVPSTALFALLKGQMNIVVLVIVGGVTFCALTALFYWCCCCVLPLLMMGVNRGLVQEPDVARLEALVRYYAGWK